MLTLYMSPLTHSVLRQDYNCEKQNVIELMYPKNTVMDLSLAAPLYFASRGNGHLFNTGEDYTTQARVLLSGLGADEALGGYGRHRVAYQKGGWEGVADEVGGEVWIIVPFNSFIS